MLYSFYCDNCKKEFTIAQGVEEKHEFICPQCKQKARRLFRVNFVIKGWSPNNEIAVDNYISNIRKALNDDTPVSKTEFEVAAEQLIKRAESRGENPDKVLSDVLGIGKKKREKVDKEELAKKAKKQRELVDRKIGI